MSSMGAIQATTRGFDTKQEHIVNKFLETEFFAKLGKPYEMVYDFDRQIKGIDVVVGGKNIDIKAQSSPRYINNPTDTYILELQFLNKYGKEMDGWFLNDDLETDFYAFVWIPVATTNVDGSLTSPYDIKETYLMVVDKNRMKDYILSRHPKESLKEMCRKARKRDERVSYYIDDGLKFSFSPKLAEKPCNIVASRGFLKKFAVIETTIHSH